MCAVKEIFDYTACVTLPIVEPSAVFTRSSSPTPSVDLAYHNSSFIPVSISDQVILEAHYGNLTPSSCTLDSVDILPLAHCPHDELPSTAYVRDLDKSLSNHHLTLPIKADLNFGSLLYALYHLYPQVSHLCPASDLTTDPTCLHTIICCIHNEAMGCLNLIFHQLGMGEFPLDLQRYMCKLAEVQWNPPHAPLTLSAPSASSDLLGAEELEHAKQVEN